MSENYQNNNGISLKWHNAFMVLLIIGAILSIISGIFLMVASEGNGLLIFLGLVTIGLAVWQLVVRNALKNFRANAISHLTTFYVLSVISSFITVIADASAGNIASLIVGIVMAIANISYYNNRKELFNQ